MSLKDDISKAIKEASAERLIKSVNETLDKFGNNVRTDAILNLKANGTDVNGGLRNSIFSTQDKELEVTIEARAYYAPFIEFGTRGFATETVGALPKEWQDIALQFKGESRGTYVEMLDSLKNWVLKRGLATKKDADEVAKNVARKIFAKGIPAQPFLYPAFIKNQKNLQKTFDEIFK